MFEWGLIVLAFTISLFAGVSLLIYDSLWTPLIIGGAVLVIGVSVFWIQKPVWALYIAVLMNTLPEGFIPSTSKSILNRFTLVAALGVWLFTVITKRRHLVISKATLSMFGFLVWSLLTLLWAPYLDLAVERIIQYTSRTSLFLLLILNEINSKQTLNRFMNIIAFLGLIIIVICFAALVFNGYQPGTPLEVFGMNRNSISEVLLISMPGVLWSVFIAATDKRRLFMQLSVIYILLALFLTVITGSRGGLIAMLSTLLTFWLWKPTRPWGKIGVIILVILLLSTPFIFSTVIMRFTLEDSATLGGRTLIWQAAVQLIQENSLFGVGIGNASRLIMPYLSLITETWDMTERALHNPLLQIWAETGLIGLIFYTATLLLAIWSFLKQFIKHMKTETEFWTSYSSIIFAVSVGLLTIWIKGGGMELAPSYFLILAYMLIPHSGIDF
jgi:O-antigen ligase